MPLIDHTDSSPLRLQLEEMLRQQLADGTLRQGDKLPSVRELAGSFGISKTTVAWVVAKLSKEGLLLARSNRGTFVTGAESAYRGRRSGNLGLICHMTPTTLQDPYYSALYHAIHNAAANKGYSILLISYQDKCPGDRIRLRSLLQERKIDGALYLISRYPSKKIIKTAETHKAPIVMMDSDGSALEVDSVVVDNMRGTRDVMQHLIRLGHKRIAFINSDSGTSSAMERLVAYRASLEDSGIGYERRLTRRADPCIVSGERAMSGLLHRSPTAVFAFNDSIAIGAIRVVESTGRSVPDDVSVVGFGDMEPEYKAERLLSTVTIDIPAMAEAAVGRLVARIDGYDGLAEKILVNTTLMVGDTTSRCGRSLARV